ncbi:hypothetical protein RCH07_000291 [Arthrobacter sp. CG_A4]|nr:hypothetical protein [Arthrobacter sp. CG_A4]
MSRPGAGRHSARCSTARPPPGIRWPDMPAVRFHAEYLHNHGSSCFHRRHLRWGPQRFAKDGRCGASRGAGTTLLPSYFHARRPAPAGSCGIPRNSAVHGGRVGFRNGVTGLERHPPGSKDERSRSATGHAQRRGLRGFGSAGPSGQGGHGEHGGQRVAHHAVDLPQMAGMTVLIPAICGEWAHAGVRKCTQMHSKALRGTQIAHSNCAPGQAPAHDAGKAPGNASGKRTGRHRGRLPHQPARAALNGLERGVPRLGQ